MNKSNIFGKIQQWLHYKIIHKLSELYRHLVIAKPLSYEMLSTQNYPNKKLSRLKNPYQSSEALDSLCSQQKLSNDSPKHYDKEKLSNVFQFNDRERIMLSDSHLGSQINSNNQSGENIYNFTSFNHQEKVQQIPSQFNQSLKTPVVTAGTFKHHQKVQKSSSLSNVNRQGIKKMENQMNKGPLFNQFPHAQQQINTITLTYQPSEVTMYRFSQHPQYESQKDKARKSDQLALIQLEGGSLNSEPSAIAIKPLKKTFKPALFNQSQSESQGEETENHEFRPTNGIQMKQPIQTQNIDEAFSFQIQRQRKSFIPKTSCRVMQEISDQNIQIFISPVQHKSALAKDKQKAKILQQEKHHLSCGSSAHSYTDTILQDMKDKLGQPIQHVQVPFESKKNSGQIRQQIRTAKDIVESKIFNQKDVPLIQAENLKAILPKFKRKKIFEPRTEKTTYNHSTNFTRTPRSQHSPYVSQFERQHNIQSRDVSPSQMLMKSLNIIDKLAAEKAAGNQKTHSGNQSRVIVVPPAPLRITQTQPTSMIVYSLSPEQVSLRKQILELSFEVSLVYTSFDIEKFDTKEQIKKIKSLEEGSLKILQTYKKLFMSQQMVAIQSSSNNALKQDILMLLESTTKLTNFQEKYIQTNAILQSLEQEIKDILLLSAKEKYKKIKLLNEAIEVIQKTQTYLSFQLGKIPVMIKTYVKKQRNLLEQLREWLKECISKQSTI